ncbi:unnamed protein product [Anisakis simplex]|uniref:Ig-like domain-containing protein n=1 Tax=Anisakis simplex TaxID=6269 RepID=A0A0M3J1I9_ANISI|nr:unnamed protein product [Anisakis simplex]
MNCDVEQEGPQSTITWLFNGSENLPPNAQVVLHGRRLYVDETSLLNQGLYQCRVRNTAGESIKNFKLRVIAPPEFVEKEYMDNIQITTGIALTLTCYVNGNPQPTIRWLRDGRDIHDKSAAFSDSNQKLIIQHTTNANHRYSHHMSAHRR